MSGTAHRKETGPQSHKHPVMINVSSPGGTGISPGVTMTSRNVPQDYDLSLIICTPSTFWLCIQQSADPRKGCGRGRDPQIASLLETSPFCFYARFIYTHTSKDIYAVQDSPTVTARLSLWFEMLLSESDILWRIISNTS